MSSTTPSWPFELTADTIVTAHTARVRRDGDQHLFTFANGYGASVIRNAYSWGLWEVAVLDADGHIDYDTPITDDVVGDLTHAEVADTLERIASLPKLT